MLYESYERRRTARLFWDQVLQDQTQALQAVPLVRRSYPVQAASAASTVVHALQLTHERPDFGVTSVASGGVDVEVSEEVVLRTPFASLVRFSKADGSSP